LGGCGPAAIEAAAPEHLPHNALTTSRATQIPPQALVAPVQRPEYAPDRWATGGTAVFAPHVVYEEPFGSSDGGACAPSRAVRAPACAAFALPFTQHQDISWGQPGLPMRLMLRILGPNCQPIAGATTTVWHLGPPGAERKAADWPDPPLGPPSSAAATAPLGGRQSTDARGIVTFDSLFPGRLRGRAVRIGVTVRRGAAPDLVTELLFDDGLVADIEASQPLYGRQGAPFVANRDDPSLPPGAHPALTLSVAQMPDGAMLAYKTLVLPPGPTDPGEPAQPEPSTIPQNSNAPGG
jgi:hypothetical protein